MQKGATIQLIDISTVAYEGVACFPADVEISNIWRTSDELKWHGVFITVK